MLKRLVVALVGLAGAVVIALGVASATLWRADDVLVAQLRADEPIVVTEPGVLELAATEVTVRVEADGPVVLAVGRDTDVDGWVGADAHQRVTGLTGWHELAADDVAAAAPETSPAPEGEAAPEGETAPEDGAAPEGEAAPEDAAAPEGEAAPEAAAAPEGDAAPEGEADAAPQPAADAAVPDPTGSDMWVLEASGDGEAELTWTQQPGRWTVLAVSKDGSAPRISLAWPQVVTTPWLWPGVSVGTLLVLLAVGLLVRDVRRARRGPEPDWTPVLTGPLPTVGGDGAPVQLTRRQLRELAARGAVADSGVAAPRTGATPSVDAPPAADPGRAATPAAEPPTPVRAPLAAGEPPTDGGRRARRAPDAAPGSGAAEGPAPASAGPGPSGDHPRDPGRRTTPGARHDGAGTPTTDAADGPSAAGAAGAPSARVGDGPAVRPAWLSRRPPTPSDERPPTPTPDPRPHPGADGRVTASPQPGPASRPGAGAGDSRPGWAPVPPPPGAVVGRSAGPDAPRAGATHEGPDRPAGRLPADRSPGVAAPAAPTAAPRPAAEAPAPRPAWLRDAPTPLGPRGAGQDAAPADAAGSRADAWRRAWGLPALPTDDDSPEEGR